MKNKTFYQSTGLLFAMLAFILLAPIGCSKDEDPANGSTTPNASVNNYIVNLPTWDIFSPTKSDSDEEFDPSLEFNCDDKVIQTTTPCSITRTPEEIVTHDPNSEILYLGSLIQGEGYIGGLGSIKSLPIYERAPITVSISFQMANNSREVENPNLSSVKEAIGDLVEVAQNAGHVSGSSIYFVQKTCHSVEQMALALGLSVKYMAGSAHLQLEYESTSESHTVSAYFVQKMFTVSMGIPQRPGDLFSTDFTQELLNEQISLGRIGPDNLPVYVSNIVYGRMMTLTMTSTYDETRMAAALDASYKNISGSLSAEHIETLENSTIKLVTIGGDAQSALDFLCSGNLGEFFKYDAPLTTAVPISYTLRNLGDNDIATVSETTDYDMVQYEPVSVSIYTSEGDWKSTVQSTMSYQKWECTLPNVLLAEEHESFDGPGAGGQWGLGKRITFDGGTTGYPFSFYLENMDGAIPANDGGQLVYDDNEGGGAWNQAISIGDIDNWENDDFEIGITSGNVYAVAFMMVDNGEFTGEYLQVFAEDVNNNECEIEYFTDEINGFRGVVSPVPIKRIWFNEDEGGDDIALGDLFFGYRLD